MLRRRETGVWWASSHVAGVLALAPAVLGIFLMVHELTLHDVIGGVTLQQGGVNFASSVALSKGSLPYDNFALSQPPGMTILLLPFAFVAHSDAAGALTAARLLTGFVAVVDVYLVAFIARHHGIASTFIAGVLFALFPYAFSATASVMFEPFLLLFCLLGFQAAFAEGRLASGGRLVLAGVLLGFAVAVKPWALAPAAVVCACAALQWRQALGRVLGGLGLGLAVPCVVFAAAAPGSFWHDVVTAELTRGTAQAPSPGFVPRLAEILGLGSPIDLSHPTGIAEGLGVLVILVVLVAAFSRASSSTVLDWALLATAGALALIALVPNRLPFDYTYYLAGFGAIVIGNSIGTLLSAISGISAGAGDTSSTVSGGLTIMCVAAMVAVVAVGAPKETDFWKKYFLQHGSNPSATIDSIVPAGSCVVSNDPEVLVLADRFTDLPAGCPYVVDPEGIEKAAGSAAAASSTWEQLLSEARYVVIAPGPPHLLLSAPMRRFVARNFSLVHDADYQVYVNDDASRA